MEDITAEPTQTEGQTGEGTQEVTATTHYPESEGAKGQSAETAPKETSTKSEPSKEVEHVFDPQEFKKLTESLPPELQTQAKALYKSLQGDYTKKMQGISTNKQKIEAYDAFNQDPKGQLVRMAKQLGLEINDGSAKQKSEKYGEDWEPQSWQEVMERARSEAKQEVMRDMGPVFDEFKNIKRQTIESQLSEIDPSWQTYEEPMMNNLQAHPTLAKDPGMLYRLSVPQEVLESRATQRALKRMEAKVDSGKVSGGSTTTKTPRTGLPDGPVSFQQAVDAAKKRLAEEGINQK